MQRSCSDSLLPASQMDGVFGSDRYDRCYEMLGEGRHEQVSDRTDNDSRAHEFGQRLVRAHAVGLGSPQNPPSAPSCARKKVGSRLVAIQVCHQLDFVSLSPLVRAGAGNLSTPLPRCSLSAGAGTITSSACATALKDCQLPCASP
jgi:hypothetical protein